MAGMWCIHHNQRFLVLSLLLISFLKHTVGIDERIETCGGKIDLLNTINVHSGILKVQIPSDLSDYQGLSPVKQDCDISIMFEGGVNLQIELYYLDIMPVSSDTTRCSSGLEVIELSTGRQIYGGRLCEEGWKWEKKHRESKQEKKVVMSSPVVFRLVSEGTVRGTGFKVHFNKFRPFWPCNNHREFKCEHRKRCIHDDITCDGWDDCGDDSDEGEDAGCELFTVSEVFALIIGIFLFIGTVASTVVFMILYRRIMKRNRLQRKESKLALEDERRSMREPSIVFPHRFNSMESVNKSQYSRTTGQKLDLDSLMDRMELEKADRYPYKDNMSERSYKSNTNRHRCENGSDRYGPINRKNRMASQSSLTKEKAGIVGSSNQNLDKDIPGERRDRDDNRESGRRSKERRRYSDDEDYDSDKERRRRRRSRDRRRYDRSDDDDYDSDLDRRRRRSRDKERYDSEDEYDSERERRRRRRSRERRRYDRSSDEDNDSDSERRRRRRSRDRRRYDSDEYDSDDRKSRSRKNLDEDNGDSDKESSRRRRRSRDRRRYDRSSDEDYDSDRDRRRRSRDRKRCNSDDSERRQRRSRDMSEDKVEKGQTRPRQGSEEKSEKPQESIVKPALEKPYYQKPEKQEDDLNRRNPYQEPEKEKPIETLRQEAKNSPPPSTPPKSEDLHRYNRRTPRSNGVAPAKESNTSAWVPRSERKKNRRSRGDPAPNDDDYTPSVYEDVVPKIQLENLGFREEAV